MYELVLYRMYVLSESNTECEFCETDHEYDVIRVSSVHCMPTKNIFLKFQDDSQQLTEKTT